MRSSGGLNNRLPPAACGLAFERGGCPASARTGRVQLAGIGQAWCPATSIPSWRTATPSRFACGVLAQRVHTPVDDCCGWVVVDERYDVVDDVAEFLWERLRVVTRLRNDPRVRQALAG